MPHCFQLSWVDSFAYRSQLPSRYWISLDIETGQQALCLSLVVSNSLSSHGYYQHEALMAYFRKMSFTLWHLRLFVSEMLWSSFLYCSSRKHQRSLSSQLILWLSGPSSNGQFHLNFEILYYFCNLKSSELWCLTRHCLSILHMIEHCFSWYLFLLKSGFDTNH